MKRLYHPGLPCNLKVKDLNEGYEEPKGSLEVIECSEGFGVFGERDLWASGEEMRVLATNPYNAVKFLNKEEKFQSRGWYFYSPIELEIELTKQCNQFCIHCWNESVLGPSLEFNALKRVIHDFRQRFGQKARITGGEPLTYVLLDRFLEFCKEEGVRKIEMTSNGALITREKAALLSSRLTDINISIHGPTPQVHDAITQSKGSFSKAVEAIGHLQGHGLNPRINFTAMPQNAEFIAEMMKLAENLSVRTIRFSCIQPRGRARSLEGLSKERLVSLRKHIFEKARDFNVSIGRSELYQPAYLEGLGDAKFYGCNGLRSFAFISAEGNIFPCSLLNQEIGNIYQDSIFDIWKNAKAQKFRESGDYKCCGGKNCEMKISCGGKCRAR
jgi:radical SAM protein with 4Fe4S-binding SPASM domain